MTSHFALMMVFAFFVSVVFSTLMHDEPKEQLRFGARLFGGFVIAGLALGWVLFFFPI